MNKLLEFARSLACSCEQCDRTGADREDISCRARAAIAAYEAERTGWRTMDSAPDNDGIWAYIPDYNMQCVAWFAEDRWWTPARENGRVAIPSPSHWMPLPAAPSPEQETQP
jgi:hypothetical protein